MSAVRAGPDHILLSIRLTPKSAVDRIEGTTDGPGGEELIAVRVRAVPEDGKANEALLRLLADALGLPWRTMTIARGLRSRVKEVRVEGDPRELSEKVRTLLGLLPTKSEK